MHDRLSCMNIADGRGKNHLGGSRWTLLTGVLTIAFGLLWLLLTMPWQPCAECGAMSRPALALAPGIVAATDSPLFHYSPGWHVTAESADPHEPGDPFGEPAGIVTFTYTGDALWLLLAPGDYWAYLYATVGGKPANRLAYIAGNTDSRNEPAGYITLLAPELAGRNEDERLRWMEIHQADAMPGAAILQDSIHTVRLEFWRGWGQRPLRAVAVDPSPATLHAAGARRALMAAPLWPGVLLLLVGGGLLATRRMRWPSFAPHARPLDPPATFNPIVWFAALLGAGLTVAGVFTSFWPVALSGMVVLGTAALVRPVLWFAALLFALPFAYAAALPLLPGRSLGIIDVGLAGGIAALAGHALLCWLTGERTEARPFFRSQRIALLLLALLVGWALVASVDTRYPALALREWRTIFLNALIFALLLVMLLNQTRHLDADRRFLVIGWLSGAAAVSLIGLWGFATGAGFVSAAEGVRRVQALYDSANNLALYLDRTVAVSLALLLFTQNRQERLLWALLVAPQGLAWLLTFSKGSLFLAAPAMLLVLGGGGFWLLRRQERRVTPLIALGAILGLGALALTPFIGAERFQGLLDFEQGTGFLRVQLWRSAWQMALDHPLLGVGPDQFLYHYRSGYLLPEAWQEPNLNHPHNLLLDWWTRLGVPGLALGIGWLAVGIAGLVRWLCDHVGRPQDAALALGCLAAAAAALAHGLIDVSYALPELMIVWVLLFHLDSR